MNKTFLAPVLCIALLILSTCAFSRPSIDVPEHPFPMRQGTYWNYEGLVRWTHDNSNRVSETAVIWRTEILRFIQHGNVQAAIVRGFPTDLDWSNGKPEPSESLLIESGGSFYLLGSGTFTDTLRRIEQPSDSPVGLLKDDDLFLKWPLVRGQKFCDAESMARLDDMYCWVVESSRVSLFKGIADVRSGKRTEFVISYRTNPDDIRFTFEPKVGLTTYEYHHHGTTADTELKLAEFHQPTENQE